MVLTKCFLKLKELSMGIEVTKKIVEEVKINVEWFKNI